MKKRILIAAIVAGIVLLIVVVIFAVRGNKSRTLIRVSPAYRGYVQAFTSGIVSANASVKVRLTDEYADSAMFHQPLPTRFFTITPSLKGTTCWVDSRTLEFRPESPLPRDQVFTVEFALGELIQVPDSLKTMVFQFQTMPQKVLAEVINQRAYSTVDRTRGYITGRLYTSDFTPDSMVLRLLSARQDGRQLPVSWLHDTKRRMHTFQIDSVMRKQAAGEVSIEWNGKAIDSESEGVIKEVVPALGDFSVVGIRSGEGGERSLVVRFTDPLKREQHLEGLFRLGKLQDIRYVVDHNLLTLYLPDNRDGKMRLVLEPHIRNSEGAELGKRFAQEVVFDDAGPNIRFAGEGNVMPSSTGMLLPFDAVNLKAVDIKVVRVFESNILQFLQVNELSTTSELVRVGRVVLKRTMPLNGVADYGRWNRFSIDLSSVMKSEPGALYTVTLSFRQQYSALECNGNNASGDDTELVRVDDPEADNERDWNYFSDYFQDDYDNGGWRNYRWEERNDPCKPSYFFNRRVSRNIIASDLGILAKSGNNGKWNVFVTDLVTTKPLQGISVAFFNYQLQQIGNAVTDAEGRVDLKLAKRPFVVTAQHGIQKGYLKLSEGTSLSMSMFDVSGEPVQRGIKGFIYGERGVWRPGDSLYLTFILEDKEKTLPASHPVSLSLFNPGGQLVIKQVRNQSTGGFYPFALATSPAAPTGNWLAKVNVGPVEFQKILKIETVKPNRLRIALDIGAEKLVKDHAKPMVLNASWLTGATAKNLKARINLTLTRSNTAFPTHPGYVFDNPWATFSAENAVLYEGRLDEKGSAHINPSIAVKSAAPGVLKASFETIVFEEGGDFSIDRFSVPYYPFHSYVGLSLPGGDGGNRLLSTDKDYKIGLISVDPEGKPVTGNRAKVEVFKLDWRWWWDNSAEGSADFISTADLTPVDTEICQLGNGTGSYTFRAGYDDWGRYLIRVTDSKSGHQAARVVFADWPGYNRMPGGEKQAATMLTITTDKRKYKVGEAVKLTIPSSAGGRALLTLESGSTVLKSKWFPSGEGSTTITFEVTEGMAPNCYAAVTLIQPHAQTVNDLPIRLYGVVPVAVEDPSSHLRPVIRTGTGFTPGKQEQITVSEATGKAMYYTLAIVDEGLLDLTRFKTPDPWQTFYAREALGVKSWDLFDQVMGAYSGELQRILSIGGDQEGELKGALKANRFKPMVLFFGPFELKAGASRTHTFTMPQYIGSVRVMVVAGRDGAYGREEKSVVVKKPLMVLGTLPRVIGPGETLRLPVSVFAMDRTIGKVKVEVEANELIQVTSAPSAQLVFNAPGDLLTNFDLKVKEATGIGRVKITATSGNQRAEHTIEIDVRNPNLPVTDIQEKAIQPGASWSVFYTPRGIPGTNSGNLELSSILPLNLESRLGFLISYPYGCVEQTTSSVFPQLYLPSMMNLSPARRATVDKNIRAGIQRIRSFQLPAGGVTYWPGASWVDDWGTSYAGHFMLEAEKMGYSIPLNFLPSWKEFQRQKALSWQYNQGPANDELAQAYRLFTLALARAPETGAMNRLLEQKRLSATTVWMLAAAYYLSGKREVAMQLAGRATEPVRPYRESAGTYGSDLRDKAIILQVMSMLGMHTKAAPLAMEISAVLASGSWHSTQSTAFALMALSSYSGHSGPSGIDATITHGEEPSVEITTKKPLDGIPLDIRPGKRGTLKVTNKSKGILYARLTLTGRPARGDTSETASNLKIRVNYVGLKGEPLDINRIPQGTSFMAEVTVSNPGLRGDYQQLALHQVFPSGWEVVNGRSSEMAGTLTASDPFDYQDVRDDRVFTYFSLKPNQSKRFRVLIMAAYQGRFYLPPASCEAMYDNSISARVAGRWVEVISAGK